MTEYLCDHCRLPRKKGNPGRQRGKRTTIACPYPCSRRFTVIAWHHGTKKGPGRAGYVIREASR